MLNAAVQNKDLPLAGLLTNVNVWDSAKSFAQFLTNPNVNSAKLSAQNLTKPNMQNAAACGTQGFIAITTRGGKINRKSPREAGSFCNSTRTRGEFLESIKKGSTADATPLIHKQSAKLCFGYSSVLRRCNSLRATSTSCCISSPALVPISSTRAKASRADRRCDSVLPSSWRRAISPCIAATIKPALLSPSIFATSIPSITSCGIRIDICFDLSLTVFVAMFSTLNEMCDSVYTKLNHTKYLRCDSLRCNLNHTLSAGKKQVIPKTATPRSAETLPRRLTTTDRACIEVAMSNRTTPHMGRASLSPNKFTWRFLAINRHDKKAKPCCLTVEAETEREARSILAPHFILSLAARLPVLGVAHV